MVTDCASLCAQPLKDRCLLESLQYAGPLIFLLGLDSTALSVGCSHAAKRLCRGSARSAWRIAIVFLIAIIAIAVSFDYGRKAIAGNKAGANRPCGPGYRSLFELLSPVKSFRNCFLDRLILLYDRVLNFGYRL